MSRHTSAAPEWSESRLERQNSMPPGGLDSRIEDAEAASARAARHRRARARSGSGSRSWLSLALPTGLCAAAGGVAFYLLKDLLLGR